MMRQPKRANPPVCWECGRKLHAGGWQYAIVTDDSDNPHPVHRQCKDEAETLDCAFGGTIEQPFGEGQS